MAADDHPGLTARRRLAEQLRALRVGAGLSTTQLAQRLGWSQAKVSRIETATHGIAPGDVRAWAETLDASAEQVEQLAAQAWTTSIEVRSWRRELAAGHAGAQDTFAQLERQARLLRSFQHLVVPGLLQTRPYAVALFQRAHPVGRDAELAADARLARQQILIHDDRLVTADSLGAVHLSDPDEIAWQIEVFTRMQQAALEPDASRAVLDGLAARFAVR